MFLEFVGKLLSSGLTFDKYSKKNKGCTFNY